MSSIVNQKAYFTRNIAHAIMWFACGMANSWAQPADTSALFPLPSKAPTKEQPSAASSNAAPMVVDAVLEPAKVKPPPLVANNVQAQASPTIRWLLFQASERSANTGQLTCLGWARSINLAKALEKEGPFHAAVAAASVREEFGPRAFWNNSSEATVVPLASKWDAPVWAFAAPDEPRDALSALYAFSRSARGSVNIAVAWDGEYLEKFQSQWLEGLVKSGDIDGLQSLSMRQKIRSWTDKDNTRVDVLEYKVEDGKIKNVQWRTMNVKMSGPTYGCPTS